MRAKCPAPFRRTTPFLSGFKAQVCKGTQIASCVSCQTVYPPGCFARRVDLVRVSRKYRVLALCDDTIRAAVWAASKRCASRQPQTSPGCLMYAGSPPLPLPACYRALFWPRLKIPLHFLSSKFTGIILGRNYSTVQNTSYGSKITFCTHFLQLHPISSK